MRQMRTVNTERETAGWDVPKSSLSTNQRAYVAGAAAVPTLICGGFGYVAAGPAGVALGALPGAAAVAAYRIAGRSALASAGAVTIGAHDQPRATNVAAGLARDLGVAPPRLYAVSHPGPNALIALADGPAIGVSRAALEELSRTELEAVLAHCLSRLNGPGRRRSIAAAVAGTAARPLLPVVDTRDDARAAALTRYPPALASVIAKARPRSGRFEALWFVASGPSHVATAERIAALEDL
jgi:hypothetical protein